MYAYCFRCFILPNAIRFIKDLGPQFDLKEEILQTHTQQEQETASTTTSSDKKSLNYSQLKKVARKRVLPELNEDDLEECFVRGLLLIPGNYSLRLTYIF